MKQMYKIKTALLFLLLFSAECYSQQFGNYDIKQNVVENGVGLGSVIAVVISWDRNHSIFYAAIHGIFGWLYVLYYAINRYNQ